MNRAQNLDRGFGVNPARARIPLLGRFRHSCSAGILPAFFSRVNIEQIAGKMPALQNSPSMAKMIVISVPSHGSHDMSWHTIFACAGADLVWRIYGNHSFSKRQ